MSNQPSPGNRPESRRLSRGIFILLAVLSLVGVAIMNYSVKYGLWYWLAMSLVSGGVSIGLAWQSAAEAGETAGGHLKRQVLHWLTLVCGILLVFFMQKPLEMDPTVGGLVALLMLAMATTLAGVHFRPRMAILGAIQVLTFVTAVVTEQFFWILLVVVVVVIIADFVIRRRRA